ncbi:MAG: DNA/RNA non-specific endonuclease [Paraprevotella sp.]|nr:DNA/RNA non-specific endonuclease [Paraprevotella sp.]
MIYNNKEYVPNRHKKKKAHHSSVFIIGMAFLAFFAVGFIVSISIRACVYDKNHISKESYTNDVSLRLKSSDSEKTIDVRPDYIISDSVVRTCESETLKGISEQIIRKTFYIASYNKDTKIPNWVAWHLKTEHTNGPYKRLSNFHEEESVASPRATLEDYRGSRWSRGHMCPAADNKWNEVAMYETFSLVNVCPQNPNLNSGLWNNLESDCRRWAKQYGDIYIVCGPLFLKQEHETIGVNNIFVPEAFFKVVLCLNDVPKGFGVVIRNTEGNKKRDLYYNSIDQVEHITGYDFFPILPDNLENSVESVVDMNLW